MCGICGVVHVHPDFPVDKGMLCRMTNIMRHRGPDSHGFYIAPGIGLGVRRLSIIDLQTGDQPISNEDGTVTVICNGEIYNFQELRQVLVSKGHCLRTKSDVEVIVHLYEDDDVRCLRHLRGMFSFALWDTHRRRLMLARDRLGIKPLHYAVGKDGLYFASEQKSILVADRLERRIDVQSLRDLFTFGFVTGPKTLFAKIRRLLPGHYLLFKEGTFSIHKYWELHFPCSADKEMEISANEWAELLLERLEESVRIHLRSDVQVGAWLSPGIDSSGIVSLMSRCINQPIQTFTLAFENSDVDEVTTHKTLDVFPGYDLPNRQIICKTKDFDLFPRALWHCEDPFTAGVEICRMILSEAASSSVKVVLTGEGSDEIFGGYPWYRADKLLRPLANLPLPLCRLIALGPFIRRWWPGASQILLAPQEMNFVRFSHLIGLPRATGSQNQLFSADLKQILGSTEHSECWLIPPESFRNWHPFVQLQYYDMKLRLPNCVVHHLDRASMAHSLEARVPFLDHKLVEFCARIPPSLKMRGLQEKHILRRAMQGVLPPDIVQRRKRALSAPLQQWLRRGLPDFAMDMLSKERLREKGYFSPDFVTHMLERHRVGKGNYGRHLLGVLGVQLWDDLFMRGCQSIRIGDTDIE